MLDMLWIWTSNGLLLIIWVYLTIQISQVHKRVVQEEQSQGRDAVLIDEEVP